MTYDEKKQWATDVLSDMALALQRKKRQHRQYTKHGAINAAMDAAAEIEIMEGELQCEQELFDLTFN